MSTGSLWGWLTSSRAPVPTKGHPDLYPLEVERLTRELDLLEQARRLGEAGLPDAGARTISGPEALVVQRIEKARQDYVDWAVRRLGILDRDFARQEVMPPVNRARQADKAFERAASALLSEHEVVLQSLRGAALARQAELDAFKERNRLQRDADFPSPGRKALLYGMLLLMVAFEAIANSFFFAEGVSTGLVGGFVFAGVFAATNVALAFLLGKVAVRQLAHRAIARRVVGLVALPLALGAMTTIALATAHLRDALTAGAPDAAGVALQTLLASPFVLGGIASWGLFLVSMLFAVASLVDGLKTDDSYPGYGRVTRRALLAAEDYDAELDDLRDAMASLRNEQLGALERDLRESQGALLVLDNLIGDKRATLSRLSNALHDADNSMDALLKRFRTENEIHRGGAPRPAYFDTLPTLSPLGQPAVDVAADEAAVARLREPVEALLAEVEALRASIQTAFSRQYDRLAPIGTQFAPGTPA